MHANTLNTSLFLPGTWNSWAARTVGPITAVLGARGLALKPGFYCEPRSGDPPGLGETPPLSVLPKLQLPLPLSQSLRRRRPLRPLLLRLDSVASVPPSVLQRQEPSSPQPKRARSLLSRSSVPVPMSSSSSSSSSSSPSSRAALVLIRSLNKGLSSSNLAYNA